MASAGTAASCHIASDVRSHTSTASVFEPEGPQEERRGHLLHGLDEDEDERGEEAAAHHRHVDAAEHAARARAERSGGVVEDPGDAGEARVHGLHAHGEEAHDVGADEADRRAGQEQPDRSAEDALEQRAPPWSTQASGSSTPTAMTAPGSA